MRLSISKRVLGAVGASVTAAAISLAGASGAQAMQPAHSEECGNASVEYSVDGGASWSTSGRITDQVHGRFLVRLTGTVGPGCEYPVSLASYHTQGPTWDTSGVQTFLGWDTTVLSSTKLQATLDVSAHLPLCFGQIDLYSNGHEFDGVHGPLPHYPAAVFPHDLITAWNGSTPCQATPSPKPSPSPTGKAPTPSPSPSVPPVVSGPVGHPVVAPLSPSPAPTPSPAPSSAPSLAHTGGNGTQAVALAGAGAALLVLGGATVVFTRRRRNAAK